ncbi:ferredoxin-type protein NapG [Halochromatium roseum]|uniref:ferredoxin-type protein NapG n=1 Tax=Halochromatium roseum TaxID=391920 RepID=UPI001911FCF2|nr:ferredoxin-type protein NapG [Halochromatium roseum]
MNRRDFVFDSLRTAAGVGLLGLGLGLYSQRAASLPAWALRPPGAQPEDDFNGACIRCGLCVRDCPFDMLHLARLGQDIPTGTPYFVAREAGCEMCEDIPCVAACPSNALDHGLTDINKADMGLAIVSDQDACIAFQGQRCEVCFDICPIRGDAITLETQYHERSGQQALLIPVVHAETCTGCGKCEEACILDEAAIKVLPRHLIQGQRGEHDRLVWERQPTRPTYSGIVLDRRNDHRAS